MKESKYKDKYCEEVIKYCGEQGLSLSSFAAQINITYETLKQWQKTFAAFKEACTLAKAKRKASNRC